MAISALEIAAIFKLEDQATVPLGKISEALKKISDQLKAVVDQAQAAFDKIGTTFGKMDTGVQSQIKQTNELAAAWDRVAASARAADAAVGAGKIIGQPGLSSPRGGAGGGHVPGLNQHIKVPTAFGNSYVGPGIFGGGVGGNAALAGAAALGYGVFKDVGISHEAFNAVWAGHADEGGMPADDVVRKEIEQFRDTVIKQAQANLVSYEDVAKLAAQEMRLGSGVDDQGKPYSFERRLQNLPNLISASAAEARQKGVSLEDAGVSFIKFAHEMKEYDPAELAKIYPALSYLSTKTDQTPAAILRASGYHLPSNMGIGIDPIQDMVLQIAMERGGAINTKSGTWLAMMAKRALPYAPGTHGRGEEHEHETLLRDFGLSDGSGTPTWFKNGKPDEMEMLRIVHDRLPELQKKYGAGLADAETKLFGTTGQRAVSLLADPKVFSQVEGMERGARAYNPAGYIDKALEFDPSAKFQKAWLDLEKVLIDIGEKALPPLVSGLQVFDDTLNAVGAVVNKVINSVPDSVKNAASAAGSHLTSPGTILHKLEEGPQGDAAVYKWMRNGLHPMPHFTTDDIGKALHSNTTTIHSDNTIVDDKKSGGNWITNHLPSWPFGSRAPESQPNTTVAPGKQSYNVIPSKENPKPITLAAQLNIDGTQLAQTIASKLADIYENSPNGPSSNDASYYDANGGIAAG